MNKKIAKLQNNIEYIYKKNEDTPRIALCLDFSINRPESKSGVYSLIARLLFQGTKKYNSEELANEFDKYAIAFSSEIFPNFLRLRFVCLNEDFSKALELLNDVVKNSTFVEFEKEKIKLAGEITSELDSPHALASDAYCRKIFENHYYGASLTKVLETLDSIEKNEVINSYNYILNNSKKSLAIVGDIDLDEILPQIEDTIGKLPISTDNNFHIDKPELNEIKKSEIIKSDLNQAHIIKGWLVPTYGQQEYPAVVLLNVILGASGMSSRLFSELRDKQGLAYVVRSSYETFRLAGNFMIYIATEPRNIETSLKGFDEQIEKIKSIPVSDKELNDAKSNIIGKYDLFAETNIQQACTYAKYGVLGLGFNYFEDIKEQIKAETSEQILHCAQKCFDSDKYVISIVKP